MSTRILVALLLALFGFSVGCAEEEKSGQKRTAPTPPSTQNSANGENGDDERASGGKGDNVADEDENDTDDDEDSDAEDSDEDEDTADTSKGDLISQITGLLGSGAAGSTGGLPIDPSMLTGLLGGMDSTQLQGLLDKMKAGGGAGGLDPSILASLGGGKP